MLIINLVFSLLKKIYLKQTLKAYSVHQYISTTSEKKCTSSQYKVKGLFRTSGLQDNFKKYTASQYKSKSLISLSPLLT